MACEDYIFHPEDEGYRNWKCARLGPDLSLAQISSGDGADMQDAAYFGSIALGGPGTLAQIELGSDVDSELEDQKICDAKCTHWWGEWVPCYFKCMKEHGHGDEPPTPEPPIPSDDPLTPEPPMPSDDSDDTWTISDG